jgi:hypothetical protein
VTSGLDAAPPTGVLAGRLGHLDLDLAPAAPPPPPEPGPTIDLDFGAGAPHVGVVDATRALEVDSDPASSFDGTHQPFDQPVDVLDLSPHQPTEIDLGPPMDVGPTEMPIDGTGESSAEPTPEDSIE